MSGEDYELGSTRRGILSGLAGATLLSGTAGVGTVGGMATATTDDVIELGTFEDDLDGWAAADGETLSRVGHRDWPPAVTVGEVALHVDAGGAVEPAVRRPLDDIDLADAPLVVADATPGVVEDTDSPVAFAFRLREDVGGDVLAASDPVTVRQAAPGRIYWDARDVTSTVLSAAATMEIAWWPADTPDTAYSGEVVLDNVRATAEPTLLEHVRFRVAIRHLEAEHGSYRRTEVEERDGDSERGAFVFASGERVDYRAERTVDGGCAVTLAGETYRFGGEQV